VAVLHSALSDGERYDAWRALRDGTRRIAVGARSALFAPLRNVGAIIVDEEHDASYKQAETPRYHAREVAIVRARESGAVCVLGSATPSLETWVNARDGRYTLLSLPDRVGGGALPSVRVVDLRTEARHALPEERARRLVLSAPLEQALHERLQRKEQSILLLNRRGYASFVQCDEGHVAVCPNCSIDSSATTACTSSRQTAPAASVTSPSSGSAGSARSRWNVCCTSDFPTRVSHGWMWTPRAGSGRTPPSSTVLPAARWISCLAHR
jgi:primosomal protein N'